MEGLLPLVFKAVKKTRSRRRYECLTSGSAAQNCDVSHFFVEDHHHHVHDREYSTPPPEKTSGFYEERDPRHRRSSTVAGEFDAKDGYWTPPIAKQPKQIVRYRSHSVDMFSCITGA
ncbi:hypothetical protein Ancab_008547 [Ancistrocladus abbreviatus]